MSNENGSGGFSDGLRDAVQEVLSGYVARSSEKIPFYCRVCLHQSENQEDFIKRCLSGKELDLVKARQRGNEGFRPTGRGRCQGRDGGSGRMGTGRGSNSSQSGDKRQWC